MLALRGRLDTRGGARACTRPAAATARRRAMIDDAEIRALVAGLSRPHPSGGAVIERAAVLASGADSSAVLAWILAHDGQPESQTAASSARRGLHGRAGVVGGALAPSRYVLPAGVIS